MDLENRALQRLERATGDDATINADYQTLCRFLSGPTRSFGSIMGGPLDVSLDAATAYAAGVRLPSLRDRWSAGRRISHRSVDRPARATGRSVTNTVLPNGCPRVKVPFQLCGSFSAPIRRTWAGFFGASICCDRVTSLFTCLRRSVPEGVTGRAIREELSVPIGLVSGFASRFYEILSARSVWSHTAHRRGRSYRGGPGAVLMITSTYNLGGSERQMLAAASGLLERGYDVRMMALYALEPGTSNIEDEVAKLGITPHLCPDFPATQSGGFRAPEARSPPKFRLASLVHQQGRSGRAAIRHYRRTIVHAGPIFPPSSARLPHAVWTSLASSFTNRACRVHAAPRRGGRRSVVGRISKRSG